MNGVFGAFGGVTTSRPVWGQAEANRRGSSLFRYAIIDLAIAQSVQNRVARQLASVAKSLLDPKIPLKVRLHGPWIVNLSTGSEIKRDLEQGLREDHWGYFIHANIDIASLRQSLRRFNLVRVSGSDQEYLFRYWDPRVMKTFLDIATSSQKRSIFEFIDAIEFADGQRVSHSSVFSD